MNERGGRMGWIQGILVRFYVVFCVGTMLSFCCCFVLETSLFIAEVELNE